MKKKLGLVMNSIPIGTILILLEYYKNVGSKKIYLYYIMVVPIVTLLLLYDSDRVVVYQSILKSYVLSVVLSMILMYLIKSPPNYWIKPFNSVSINFFSSTLILLIQLLLITFINIFKKE